MMAKQCVLLLFLIPIISYAQNKRLFLYKENDSTLSVRDQNNQILIPPYRYYGSISDKKEELVNDLLLISKSPADYELYNRDGKFLFNTTVFDFMAEFQEGHIGIAKNGKQGLITKEGLVVIPAEYDWIGFLTNGIVEACKKCYFDRSKDPEHPPLVGGTWFQLNRYGDILDQYEFGESRKQIDIYPYAYSEHQKKLLERFNKFKNEIANKLKLNPEDIKFEITYEPTKHNPYYHIKLYQWHNGWTTYFDSEPLFNFQFDLKTESFIGFYKKTKLYKKNGEEIFEVETIKQPIEKWLKNKKVTSI